MVGYLSRMGFSLTSYTLGLTSLFDKSTTGGGIIILIIVLASLPSSFLPVPLMISPLTRRTCRPGSLLSRPLSSPPPASPSWALCSCRPTVCRRTESILALFLMWDSSLFFMDSLRLRPAASMWDWCCSACFSRELSGSSSGII